MGKSELDSVLALQFEVSGIAKSFSTNLFKIHQTVYLASGSKIEALLLTAQGLVSFQFMPAAASLALAISD